jgi:para-nitrobenzyl esterase
MHSLWSRRRVLITTAAALAAPALWRPQSVLAQAAATTYTLTTAPYLEVETAQGRVRGGHSRGALAFKGIPYAGSVTGVARFKEAPPPQSWTGVRDATKLGSPSMQGPGTTYGENEPPYSEDCLVLNVWTPAVNDGRKRPVMVYCHGGGYTTGSGGSKDVDGAHLAAAYDVVVVTTNHRLGLLGYLYLGGLGGAEYASSGNQGMLDIVAALRWVKANIEVFGGDPGNVTIQGESGGGFKVGTLMAMPSAQGLFHKAIIESGSSLRRVTQDEATEAARRVLRGLGIGEHELHKLAGVPAEEFVKIQLQSEHNEGPLATPSEAVASGRSTASPAVGPVVEGHFLPQHPFDPAATPLAANIPLLVGFNHDEATFFTKEHPEVFHIEDAALTSEAHKRLGANADRVLSVYKQTYPKATPAEIYIAAATALTFGNDTITLAERKSAQPAPVYLYRYEYRSNVPITGTDWTLRAGHATEIAMKFYNYDIPALEGNGPGIAEASKNMSSLWTSFARNGHPGVKGLPAWPRYDLKRRATMLINTECRVVDDPDRPIRELWVSLPPMGRTG